MFFDFCVLLFTRHIVPHFGALCELLLHIHIQNAINRTMCTMRIKLLSKYEENTQVAHVAFVDCFLPFLRSTTWNGISSSSFMSTVIQKIML